MQETCDPYRKLESTHTTQTEINTHIHTQKACTHIKHMHQHSTRPKYRLAFYMHIPCNHIYHIHTYHTHNTNTKSYTTHIYHNTYTTHIMQITYKHKLYTLHICHNIPHVYNTPYIIETYITHTTPYTPFKTYTIYI